MNFGALAAFIMITLIAVWGRREKDLTSYIKCVGSQEGVLSKNI